jgi:hypothetical protein
MDNFVPTYTFFAVFKTTVTMLCMRSPELPLNIYADLEFLDHMVIVVLFWGGISIKVLSVYIPSTFHKGSSFSVFLPILAII